MKKTIAPLVMIILLVLTGCEAVFTASPLSFLQRSPAQLTPEGKLLYGLDALDSGDAAQISAAYEAIADYIDSTSLSGTQAVEFNSLAVDLLAADTGIGPLFDDAVAGYIGDDAPTMESILADLAELDVSGEDASAMIEYMNAVTENDGEPGAAQSLIAASVVLAPLVTAFIDPDTGKLSLPDGSGGSVENFDEADFTILPDDVEEVIEASIAAAAGFINNAAATFDADSSEAEMLYELSDLLGMGINPSA